MSYEMITFVILLKGKQLTAMMKLDLKDADSNYAVDIRDPTVVVSINVHFLEITY